MKPVYILVFLLLATGFVRSEETYNDSTGYRGIEEGISVQICPLNLPDPVGESSRAIS